MIKPLISVVVCTYNRADLLSECLKSLTLQTLEPSNFEVIVVDNNSKDGTPEIVSQYIDKFDKYQIVSELNQGFSHARNRGWREAQGDYIAYIDDDAVAMSDWVAQMYSFIERQPQTLAFGGPFESFSLTSVPCWFPTEYGSLNLGEEERPIKIGKEWITGTNIIIKKEVLSELGGFDPNPGIGEDTRLLLELNKKYIEVYYVPSIKVRHLIADYKIRLSWLLSSAYKTGRSSTLTYGKPRTFVSHISSIVICTLSGVIKMICCNKEPLKRNIYHSFFPLYVEIGSFVEYLSK